MTPRTFLRMGWNRVRAAALPIFLAAVAAAVSWAFARQVLGQPYPFFAPAAAWISLGFTRDRRARQVAELAIGVSLGVALGEFLGHTLGVGAWQIGLALFVAALLARLLDRGPLLTSQAGLQAIIIVALPASLAGGSFGRWIDALVGGTVALLVAVLVPGRSWLHARQLARASLGEVAGALALLARALRRGEARRAADALTYAREAQPTLEEWRTVIVTAQEAARFSPVARRHRWEVARLDRACTYSDHAMRNARVVSRRAIATLEEEAALPAVADVTSKLARAADAIGEALGAGMDPTSVRPALRALVAELQPERFAEGWRVQSLVVLLRSLLVDLLEVTGLDYERAKAEFASGGSGSRRAALAPEAAPSAQDARS
jgi:uncharacterized membrane protein YgaE (UPF0421/DUF939 family)